MSGPGFTPGPWSVDEDDLSIRSKDGAHICSVTDVQDLPCLDSDENDEEAVQRECLANAHLIAAASDLYAFAQSVAEPYAALTDKQLEHAAAGNPGGFVVIDIPPQIAKAVIGARTALARATGATP